MDDIQKKSSDSLLRLTLKTLIGEGVRLEESATLRIRQAFDKFFQDSTLSKSLGTKVSTAIVRRIVKSFAGSRGLSIKAAQLASFLDLGLSAEFSHLLGDLQTLAKPLSQRRVQELVREAYPNFENIFFFIDWTPIAVTSLAQVHRAQLHSGQDVILKIKHPEIHKIVRTQFKTLELLVILGDLIGRSASETLQEIQHQVLLELDYEREVMNQKIYRDFFNYIPTVLIPQVHEDLCRSNIIVCEYIAGQNFQDFNATASEEQKTIAGLTVAFVHSVSVLRLCKIHGDAHPSNFLFKDGKVVFLDFGRIIECTPERVQVEKKLYNALLGRDKNSFISVLKEKNLIMNPGNFDYDGLWDLYSFHQRNHLVDGPFRFTKDFLRAVNNRTREFKDMKFIRMDRNLLHTFLFTANLWALFSEMEVEANWRKMAIHLLQSSDSQPTFDIS